jgi:hypothetical protein
VAAGGLADPPVQPGQELGTVLEEGEREHQREHECDHGVADHPEAAEYVTRNDLAVVLQLADAAVDQLANGIVTEIERAARQPTAAANPNRPTPD